MARPITPPSKGCDAPRRICPAGPERRGFLRLLGGFGLGLLTGGVACAALPQPPLTHVLSPVSPPRPAPDFVLPDLDGKHHKLSDYRGKVVLVNFWATWCPPCRREMPSIERLYQALKGEPFQVLACDQEEGEDAVFSFSAMTNPSPSFPLLLDRKSEVAKLFGVRGMPTSFLVDKTGHIVYRAVGGREFDHPAIRAIVERLIKTESGGSK